MSCHLLDLQPEIHLIILEELLHRDDSDNQEQDANFDGRCSLCREDHSEEQRRDRRRLRDIVSWSCTSSYFRNLLVPYILKSVTLRNTNDDGLSLNTLTKTTYGALIKEIHFVGSAPDDKKKEKGETDREYKDRFQKTDSIFPESVGSLLSDLRRFPSLEFLSIKFAYHVHDDVKWVNDILVGAEAQETDEQVKESEESGLWRALMNETYEALSKNEETHIKALELKHIMPKRVSAFSSTAFHNFLGQLQQFSVSLYGCDNTAGWKINTSDVYIDFVSKLDTFFFDHLTSVTDLTIKAPEEGPLGLGEAFHPRLALKKDHMPLLKIVNLEYIFIGQELIDFVAGHTETLEVLSLHHGYSTLGKWTPKAMTWKKFFDSLHEADARKLRCFELSPVDLPSKDIDGAIGANDENAWRQSPEARQVYNTDPTRRVFPYANLDTKYGMIFEANYEDEASFLAGQDQASFETLIKKIELTACEQ